MEKPEIFIALISPIGVNLDDVIEELTALLHQMEYEANTLKFTDILYDLGFAEPRGARDFSRYEQLISAGNKFCKTVRSRDALARAAIAKIYDQQPDRPNSYKKNTAYIFRQIKRVEEAELLEQVYGPNVVFISCWAPKRDRINHLKSLMLSESRQLDHNQIEAECLRIIGIDENQKNEPDGQRFFDVYPWAHFVADCSSKSSISRSLKRFVECFFPTISCLPSAMSMVCISHTLRACDQRISPGK
jgi:cytidine deaminase